VTANLLQQTFNCFSSCKSLGGRKQWLFTRSKTTFKSSRKYFVPAKAIGWSLWKTIMVKKIRNNGKRISFLEKYFELQNITGSKSKQSSMMAAPEIQTVLMQTK